MHTVFSDIDDTLTTDGQLVPQAYVALDTLRRAGLRVILITGAQRVVRPHRPHVAG